MSFSAENGYIPASISELMALVMAGVNEQFGTTYDAETFLGTNLYKYFYALIQQLQGNEIKTSEIVLKLQQYFIETNEIITRPNTTHPGVIDYLAAAGYTASTKKPEEGDAGKLYVCVDIDDDDPDYATKKLEICNLIAASAVAGVVTMGTETEAITLTNQQSFDFKFNLPSPTPIILKLTLTQSANNQFTVLSPEAVAQLLFDNIAARYRVGLDFEPQRYFSVVDAPWCASVLLEWSDDAGDNWYDDIFEAAFDDVFTFDLGDITVVES